MPSSMRPPVVFLAFANDHVNEGRHLSSLKRELKQIRDALQQAAAKGLCEVVERNGASRDDVISVFLDPRYQGRIAIFHFAGHAGASELLMESESGDVEIAAAGGLAKFMGLQNSLQLVFLNGCSTVEQSVALLAAGVSSVISTQQPINDELATGFSANFYRALASHSDLQTAFEIAIAAAETQANGPTRALGFDTTDSPTDSPSDTSAPWTLTFAVDDSSAARWSLQAASNNPLLALPPLPKMDLPAKPFRYLNWYRRKDAAVFFGRGEQIYDLYNKVTHPSSAPVILYYGRSGVGKSSLLDAGLIPRLESTQEVVYLRRDREKGLLGTVAEAFPNMAVDQSPRATWLAHEADSGKPLTIILDQLEEIETRPNASINDEMKRFMDAVHEVFQDPGQRPRGRLILGFRKEWLADVKKQLETREVLFNEVFLEHLDRDGVIEAILGPIRDERLAAHYQLSIDEGLAEQISDDLLEDSQGNIAPTLQILLSRMWDSAKETNSASPRFTKELYASRRKGMLMSDFLKEQLAFLEDHCSEYAPPDLLIDALAMHTTPLGTANQISMDDLRQTYRHHEANLSALLTSFQDAYLLTMPDAHAVNEIVATRLAHDTLAPLVRERFEASPYPGQHARKILENRVGQWDDGQVGTPLDEEDLAIVESGRNGMRAWTADEERLIEASRTAREKREADRRFWKSVGVVALVLLIATAITASVFGVIATQQKTLARKALEKAEDADAEKAEALVATKEALSSAIALEEKAESARAVAETQRRRAEIESQRAQSITYGSQIKLAQSNWERGRPATAIQNLNSTQPQFRGWEHRYLTHLFSKGFTELKFSTSPLQSIALSPPTQMFPSAPIASILIGGGGEDESYAFREVNASDGSVYGARGGRYSEICCVDYSPDGLKQCRGYIDGKLELQNNASGETVLAKGVSLGMYPRTHPIGIYPNAINCVAFSPDSRLLASGDAAGGIRIWQTGGETEPRVLQSKGASVEDIQFTPDGKSIAFVSDDGTLKLVTLPKLQEPKIIGEGITKVQSLAISPDGALIATGGDDLIVWDIAQEEPAGLAMRSISGLHKDLITCLAFTSDGSRLVSGSLDQTVKVWDVRTRDLVQTHLGQHCAVTDLCLTPDGQKIYSCGTDGVVKTWSVDPAPARKLTNGWMNHIEPINRGFVAFGGYPVVALTFKNGRKLPSQPFNEPVTDVAIRKDSSGWFYSNAANGQLTNLQRTWIRKGATNDGKCVALSPDGAVIALTLANGEIELLQSIDGTSIRRLEGHKDFTGSVAFNSNGLELVSVGGDGIKIWDVPTGELQKTIDLSSFLEKSQRTMLPTSSSDYFPCQVAFTPDSERIIVALGYGLGLSLWNVEDGKLMFRFGNASSIGFFAVSPDGERIASQESPEGNGVDVWETRFGNKVLTLEGHPVFVMSVAFTDDGSTLVSGDSQGNLFQWKTTN